MNIDRDLLCQRYLDVIYHDLRIQAQGEIKRKNMTESYGEVLSPSIDKLLSVIPLTENDIFMDLGSGVGRVVLHFFLKSRVKQALGIELLPHLHLQAQFAAQRMELQLPDFFKGDRKINFLLGDFLEIPFDYATVLFINSICYSPSILSQLEKIINTLPNVHTVLTMRPFHGLQKLSFKKTIRVECSWDSALCYVYSI